MGNLNKIQSHRETGSNSDFQELFLGRMILRGSFHQEMCKAAFVGVRSKAPLIYFTLRQLYSKFGEWIVLQLYKQDINDIINPEWMGLSKLEILVIPSRPGIDKALPKLHYKMDAVSMACAEIAPLTIELSISQAISSRFSSSGSPLCWSSSWCQCVWRTAP